MPKGVVVTLSSPEKLVGDYGPCTLRPPRAPFLVVHNVVQMHTLVLFV